MTTVLALDLDVTKAGVACPTGRLLTLTAPVLNARRGVAHGHRLAYWHAAISHLVGFYRPDLVVAEAIIPTPGRVSTGLKAGVHAVAHLAAHTAGAYWDAGVYPSHLKAWATGDGTADKAAMIRAAEGRGAAPANDDEADAALLRLYVLDVLDSPEGLRAWLAR